MNGSIDDVMKKFNETAYDIGKLLITLSTGTLVLSVTFCRDMLKSDLCCKSLLFLGWGFEIGSLFVGTLFLFAMLRVYDRWHEIRTYSWLAVSTAALQYVTFILGLLSLTLFAAFNLR
jgi:hypothetical protein